MERFQGKILEAMSLLSRLWKGVENIRKAPSHEAVELWVDKLVTLVEQVNSLFYHYSDFWYYRSFVY